MNHLNAAAALLAATITERAGRPRRGHKDADRGSSVVETIILVAGFAGLAFTIYLAVSGKVEGWIAKIPG